MVKRCASLGGYAVASFLLVGRMLGFVVWVAFAAGCASAGGQKSQQAAIIYPQETDNFVFVDIHSYANPLLGERFRYLDKKYTDDIIEVFVYPIPDFQWSYTERALRKEMAFVIEDIDRSLARDHKGFRSEPVITPFKLMSHSRTLEGIRYFFELTNQHERKFDAYVYLFMEKDKYIRVRTIFDAQLSPGWNGDKIVEELIPKFEVPAESAEMRERRKQAEAEYKKIVREVRK